MKYCSHCGSPTQYLVPDGDNRPRNVCTSCHAIHYVNPRIVAGAICLWEGDILLCRRAIEPRRGKWTLPAGFLEIGETMAAGALRETREESGAVAEIEGTLFAVLDVPHAEQVHVFYRARLVSPDLDPGDESLEARLFDARDIPWDDIAFSTVETSLRWFLGDRESGHFLLHEGVIPNPTEHQPSPPHPDATGAADGSSGTDHPPAS